jgi:hypothetical protein
MLGQKTEDSLIELSNLSCSLLQKGEYRQSLQPLSKIRSNLLSIDQGLPKPVKNMTSTDLIQTLLTFPHLTKPSSKSSKSKANNSNGSATSSRSKKGWSNYSTKNIQITCIMLLNTLRAAIGLQINLKQCWTNVIMQEDSLYGWCKLLLSVDQTAGGTIFDQVYRLLFTHTSSLSVIDAVYTKKQIIAIKFYIKSIQFNNLFLDKFIYKTVQTVFKSPGADKSHLVKFFCELNSIESACSPYRQSILFWLEYSFAAFSELKLSTEVLQTTARNVAAHLVDAVYICGLLDIELGLNLLSPSFYLQPISSSTKDLSLIEYQHFLLFIYGRLVRAAQRRIEQMMTDRASKASASLDDGLVSDISTLLRHILAVGDTVY